MLARRCAFVAALLATLSSWSAFAQAPSKILNPQAAPPAVRPGAIEAQYKVDLKPDFSGAPAVMSPYEPDQPANAADIVFRLQSVAIDGGGALPPEKIESFYRGLIGQEIKLTAVFDIAREITRAYAEAGYPLSLAYVPVQEIENGAVSIRIVEGYIGEINIVGAPSKAEKYLRALGEKLKHERPLRQKTLERYLLLANRLPGLNVTGVFERAASPDSGVSMTLKVDQKRLSISAGVNNRASEAVGRRQFYGRLGVNSLLTGSDDFSFAAVQSFELDELTYFASSYGTVLNAEGLALQIKATRSEAAPGIPFLRDLGFQTEGWTAGTDASYPLIARRGESLTLNWGISWKNFKSAFGVSPNTEDTLWTTHFGGAYTRSDRFDGTNTFGFDITRGWDIFGATKAGSPLASRAGAGGEFVTVTGEFTRNQRINDWMSATLSVQGQTANKPLLSSEQCGFGGAGFGRGYNSFTIAGDRCVIGLVELQASPDFLTFNKLSVAPYVSVDAGAVRQIGALAAGESRNASLYSAAAGLRIGVTKYLSAQLEGGFPLKGYPTADAEKKAHFFFRIEARY